MNEELLSLTLLRVQPISRKTIIAPSPLNVNSRRCLHKSAAFSAAEVPHCLDVLVLCQGFCNVVPIPIEDIYNTTRQVGGFKNLIQFDGGQRICWRRHTNHGIATGHCRHHKRDKSKQWELIRACDSDNPRWFVTH